MYYTDQMPSLEIQRHHGELQTLSSCGQRHSSRLANNHSQFAAESRDPSWSRHSAYNSPHRNEYYHLSSWPGQLVRPTDWWTDVQPHSATCLSRVGVQPPAGEMVPPLTLAILEWSHLYQFGASPHWFYPGLQVPLKRCLHTHATMFSAQSFVYWSDSGSQSQICWTSLASSKGRVLQV